MHVFICRFLQDLFYLLVCFGHVVLVFTLDVEIQLSATDWHLFAQLYKYSSQRNGAISLVLDSLKKSLTACLLPCSERVVIDLEVV